MATQLTARASVSIEAPPERVWRALTDPDAIRRYMAKKGGKPTDLTEATEGAPN